MKKNEYENRKLCSPILYQTKSCSTRGDSLNNDKPKGLGLQLKQEKITPVSTLISPRVYKNYNLSLKEKIDVLNKKKDRNVE